MNKLIYWLSKPWFFIIVFAFLLTPSVKITSAIESGADFLNTTIGAKPSAMGQASTAITNDINAVQTNPAGLANLNAKQFGAMHSRQYFDTTQDFIGFAFPTKNIGTLALSITRLAHEKIEGRTSQRQTTQGFTASDQSINLSAGKALTSQTNAGVNLKLITSEIAGEKAQTAAIDLGITHKFKNKPITAGITAKNIGPGLKYINQRDPLPLSITLGIALDIIPGCNLAMDIKRLIYDKENTISLGTEYHVTNGFYLRAGYMNTGNQGQKEVIRNITGGVGINLLGSEIDYAVSPAGELGDTQKISIKKKF